MIAFLGLSVPCLSFAGECTLDVTRTACSPETEKESFSKCNGKPTCEEKSIKGTEKSCLDEAVKACYNPRPTITKSKKITVKFDGKSLNDGKDVCSPVQEKFNFDKCK